MRAFRSRIRSCSSRSAGPREDELLVDLAEKERLCERGDALLRLRPPRDRFADRHVVRLPRHAPITRHRSDHAAGTRGLRVAPITRRHPRGRCWTLRRRTRSAAPTPRSRRGFASTACRGCPGQSPCRSTGPTERRRDPRIPSFDWRLSASALGFPVPGHSVSTGDNVYLTVYGNQYEVRRAGRAPTRTPGSAAAGGAPRLRSWLGTGARHRPGQRGRGRLRANRRRSEGARRPMTWPRSPRRWESKPPACPAGRSPAWASTTGSSTSSSSEPLSASRRRTAPGSPGPTAIHLQADAVLSDVGKAQRDLAPGPAAIGRSRTCSSRSTISG